MAVPKQRQNSSRRNRRRKHNLKKITPVALQKCASCGELTQPHRVCTSCGVYRDIQHKEIVQKVSA